MSQSSGRSRAGKLVGPGLFVAVAGLLVAATLTWAVIDTVESITGPHCATGRRGVSSCGPTNAGTLWNMFLGCGCSPFLLFASYLVARGSVRKHRLPRAWTAKLFFRVLLGTFVVGVPLALLTYGPVLG